VRCIGREVMRPPEAILCIDIDGTLIDSKERVHARDIHTFNNLPEVFQPILTTGRILHSAKGVLKQNGLLIDSTLDLPGVFMNGGVAYLPFEELHTQHAFVPATLKNLMDLATAYPTSAFTFFGIDAVYLVNATDFGKYIAQIHYLDAQETEAKAVPSTIVKVMILEQDIPTLKNIELDAQILNAEMAYSLPYAFEINPPGITKARTLSRLLHAMRLDSLPIHVVGDGENDLSLFEIARINFAPDTSHPKVLDQADYIFSREPRGLLAPILEIIQNK